MEGTNDVFQKLKPACVALNGAVLAMNGPASDANVVVLRLEQLQRILLSITSRPDALDAKLAEYVFFPLSNMLKASQRLPVRCLELALQCIGVVVEHGWRQHLSPQLAVQLVILCTLLADKNPRGNLSGPPTEELISSALRCLYQIFSIVKSSTQCRGILTDDANFPQLAQTISTVLDNIENGPSSESQLAATCALEALLANIHDREILASFLPGIVSKLTNCLTPQTKQRRNYKVLVGCIDVFGRMLLETLRDDELSDGSEGENLSRGIERKSIINDDWRSAAATQLKIALNNIFRLKNHDKINVRQALASLCIIILRDCMKNLSTCCPMALETILTIQSQDSDQCSPSELDCLVEDGACIVNMLQNLLYEWLQSLPSIMKGSDEQLKLARIRQISSAYRVLSRNDAETASVDRILARMLRDSLTTITEPRNSLQQSNNLAEISPVQQLQGSGSSQEFELLFAGNRDQVRFLSVVADLVKDLRPGRQSTFIEELIRFTHSSQDQTRVSSFWLLLTSIEHSLKHVDAMESYLNVENETASWHVSVLEELYSISVPLLDDAFGGDIDPHMKRLSLRALAMFARISGRDFRCELVDALYPVLHTLATNDEHLQRDSITTLNLLASACEYQSVEALIIDNVDYLLNAVALKLNTFDVSPQAPQVLLMMLRLAGPSLLPYLEDTIESIFAALENYHGYPLLVELLFKVLSVMAEEGVKTPQLAITFKNTEETPGLNPVDRWRPTNAVQLAQMLEDRLDEQRRATMDNSEPREHHLETPWGHREESSNTDDMAQRDLEANPIEDVEPSPPAPTTYNLLLKITSLSQHFLPAASSSLRTSLLGLVKTTTPVMARHENSFLPLINTLWPEIVARLYDEEPFIVSAALDVISELCANAGDFMRSRIAQLWPRLIEIYNRVSDEMMALQQARGATSSVNTNQNNSTMTLSRTSIFTMMDLGGQSMNYADTFTRSLCTSLIDTLTTIVERVSLSPEMYDELLEMLRPMLHQNRVRLALERENADALWLSEARTGSTEMPEIPQNTPWRFAALPA